MALGARALQLGELVSFGETYLAARLTVNGAMAVIVSHHGGQHEHKNAARLTNGKTQWASVLLFLCHRLCAGDLGVCRAGRAGVGTGQQLSRAAHQWSHELKIAAGLFRR